MRRLVRYASRWVLPGVRLWYAVLQDETGGGRDRLMGDQGRFLLLLEG